MNINYDHQIFSNQNFGGPSRYFVELIKELINLKNQPVVIAPFHQNIYLAEISSKFKKDFFFKIGKKNLLTQKINDLVSNYIFGKNNYDLYHLTYYNKCFDTKKPKTITVYDLIHEKFMDEFDLKSLPKKKVFSNIDHFFCISNNTKNDLMDYYNIDEKKITVTYLANSIKNYNSLKNNSKKPYFLYVGSRKRYKNFKIILESYSKLPEIMENFDIICFGGGKFLKEEIEYMNQLSIDLNKVHYKDGSDEVLSSLYTYSEALIYPSKYEGFGLPILEAMSLGCPVISSNTSSLPEVYGHAALTFSPESIEDLMQCLIKITTNDDLKKKLISKGYKREKEFSWKKCALETSSVYKSLI